MWFLMLIALFVIGHAPSALELLFAALAAVSGGLLLVSILTNRDNW